MSKFFLSLATVLALLSCNNEKATTSNDALVKSETVEKQPMPAEIADARYIDMGKAMMKDFAAGNIDAWGQTLADNVVYQYSSGDSLAGKQAVMDYWKDRYARVVKTVTMANDIWLPMQVNVPQKGPDMPGLWLLNWSEVTAEYRNGKTLKFWVHQSIHLNPSEKVDRIVMYMDRAPVNAALAAK